MKKVTIITTPEYEGLVLESLGSSGVTQLKEVSGLDFERFRGATEKGVDYKALYQKVHSRYLEFLEPGDLDVQRATLGIDEYKRFASDPKAEADAGFEDLERLTAQLNNTKEAHNNEVKRLDDERFRLKARLESVRALQPEEFKRCFAVGVTKNEVVTRLEEHLKRYPDVSIKAVSTSLEDSLVFIFGSEESRRRVEMLFLVFDVKDIFEVLDTKDILLVLDPEKRSEAIKRYELELEAYDGRMKELGARHARETESLKEQRMQALSKITYMDTFLRILSDDRAPVLRTKVISVLQGWVPEQKIPVLEKAVNVVESQTGEKIFIQFEDPDPEDHVPTLPAEIKPSFLQPAWTLTTLRGWPNVHEINPSLITILVFSFQFGLMFGDVGQGAIFLILGLILSRKYKRGMMSKLAVMFVPMGVISIIFGFLYGEVFLVEGLIHPILFSPLQSIGKLMKMVLGIAVVEMCLGLALGAINHIKEGKPLGALGEHGAGAILFLVGLYLGGLYFLQVGSIFALFSHWTFYLMLGGLILSAVEPILTAVIVHKHFGFESVGEGIGALLMTFVESLCNFFSFLRIAAFTLAHASLAIAAESLVLFMGPGGFVVANGIAMTFEFISSSVQSLRLLYYEFMGKFFHGDGTPFKPYIIGKQSKPEA